MEDERDVSDAPIEEQSESTMVAMMDDNTDGTASTADEPTEMSTEDIDNGNNSNDQVADNEEEVVVDGEVERPPPRLMITKMVSLILLYFVALYMSAAGLHFYAPHVICGSPTSELTHLSPHSQINQQ